MSNKKCENCKFYEKARYNEFHPKCYRVPGQVLNAWEESVDGECGIDRQFFISIYLPLETEKKDGI